MMGQIYRLNLPTLGIHMKDGQRIQVMVPKGALIAIEGGPLDGMRLVDVAWDGVGGMMFTADVRQRGTLVESAVSAIGTCHDQRKADSVNC